MKCLLLVSRVENADIFALTFLRQTFVSLRERQPRLVTTTTKWQSLARRGIIERKKELKNDEGAGASLL